MSYRWRAPKKTNDRAWKMIERGDWLWDKRYIASRATTKRKQFPSPWERRLIREFYAAWRAYHRAKREGSPIPKPDLTLPGVT